MILTETTARQLVDDRRASLVGTWRQPSLFRRTRRARRPAATSSASDDVLRDHAGAPPGSISPAELAELVAEFGIGRFERRIGRLVRSARAAGVEPFAVDVLADRWAPRAARERALGIVLVGLAASSAGTHEAEAGAA